MAIERYRSVAKSKLPRFVPRARAPRDAASTERGQVALLDQVERGILTGAKIYEKEKALADRDRAVESYNKFTTELSRPRAEYLQTRLTGASDSYADYADTVQSSYDKYYDDLSAEQKRLFKLKADGYRSGLEQEAQGHMAKASIKAGEANRATSEFNAVRDAHVNVWDPKWDDNVVNTMAGGAAEQAAQLGLARTSKEFGEFIDMQVAEKYSDYLSNKIVRMSNESGVGAMAYFSKNKQYLKPETIRKLEPLLKREYEEERDTSVALDIYQRNKNSPMSALKELSSVPKEQRASVYKRLNEMLQIDKQRARGVRAGVLGSFHQKMQSLDIKDPGSIADMVQWIDGSISPGMDVNEYGASTKDKMRNYFRDELMGKHKTSDPRYVMQLQSQLDNPSHFANMDIDSASLSNADNARYKRLQSVMQSSNGAEIGRIRNANKAYRGIIDKVLIDNGITINEKAGGVKQFNSIRAKVMEHFADSHTSAVAYGGEDGMFLDPNVPDQYARNKALLTDRLDTYVKQLLHANMLNPEQGLSSKKLQKALNKQLTEGTANLPVPLGDPTLRNSRAVLEDFLKDVGTVKPDYVNELPPKRE